MDGNWGRTYNTTAVTKDHWRVTAYSDIDIQYILFIRVQLDVIEVNFTITLFLIHFVPSLRLQIRKTEEHVQC